MKSLKDEIKRRRLEKDIKKFITDEELVLLMKNINMELVLKSAGIDVKKVPSKEGEYVGYCPDHYQYTGKYPSAPKWYINSINGKCKCFTESRASNILSVLKNVLGMNTEREVYNNLLEGKEIETPIKKPKFVKEIKELKADSEEKRKKSLEKIAPVLEKGYFNNEMLKYFKKNDITEETLSKYGISACNYGSYKDRAIIPFFDKNLILVGFIAVDYLGKEEWIKRRKEEFYKIEGKNKIEEMKLIQEIEKRYRKTLYCPGFVSSSHLYGLYEKFDNPKEFDYLVLVEGERDCLKLMQEGINCVSVHGSCLKQEQIIMIEKISHKKVFLGFDMDEAGNEAVKQSFEALKDKIEEIYVLNFPEGKDPKCFDRKELLEIIEDSEKNKIVSRRN